MVIWYRKSRGTSISKGKREIYKDKTTQQTWWVDAHAVFVYDANYGADADGHRGVGMWFIDDIVIDNWGVDLEIIPEAKVPVEIKDKLDNQLDEIEDWEIIEEDEPDYGDHYFDDQNDIEKNE